VTKVYPAYSENGPVMLSENIAKKLVQTFPGSVKISHLSTRLPAHPQSSHFL